MPMFIPSFIKGFVFYAGHGTKGKKKREKYKGKVRGEEQKYKEEEGGRRK